MFFFFFLAYLISFFHYFQGYDDIPKEIPDPDAKKVLKLAI